jgi:curved DNA-binding protein CbpA
LDTGDHIDYYTILGVSQYAKYREIRKAYRRLALKYHPDRNSSPFAEDVIKTINAAFEILSDKDKRRQYDNVAIFDNIARNKEKIQTHVDVKSEKTNTTNTTNDISSKPKGRFHIIVEPTLCMAFGSCEVLAPNVFVVEKDKMINPKARVESETGDDFETIVAAAQTCPTKAIIIIDRYTGEQIYP